MPDKHTTGGTPTLRAGHRLRRPVRWGYVRHGVGKDGATTARLVVYPPVSVGRERFPASMSGAPVRAGRGLPARLRSRVPTAGRVGFPPRDDDEGRDELITTVALVMQRATAELRRGRITRRVHERVWLSVYEEAYAVSALDAVADLPRRPSLFRVPAGPVTFGAPMQLLSRGFPMPDRDDSHGTKRYGATLDGHDVELEFDRKLWVLNRSRLRIDGELVDQANIFYGERDLRATLPEGTTITVKVDSGMYGELTRAQVQRSDGSWIDLGER